MDRPTQKSAAGEAAVWRALDWLEGGLQQGQRFSLGQLAAHVGLSEFHLQRRFRQAVGLSPRRYQEKRRLQQFKQSLRSGEDVLAAALDAGFDSLRRPYELAPRELGMSPGAYRRGGRGLQLRYCLFSSPLGRALLAASERGICALYLGDGDVPLQAELLAEFCQAELLRSDSELQSERAVVLAYLGGQRRDLDLNVDLIGAEFQRRVWDALRQVPYGQTRSYAAIAASIGQPRASRAVAGACAANRIALIIPCHRVVGSDGALRGYRWHPDRKRRLLELEKGPGSLP
ncbi:MAG: methylated-DNA--[protein]-cysteine S-methyltransferase [Leptospirales bacterium]|nr:methylated-DNA--[protein]-cysteine S-methyltransferase [Leptospirales bacterium]